MEAGVDIGMVQVGNETNGAMCGEYGTSDYGWEKIARLMSAGSKAVREVCPHAPVVLHFTNPETAGRYAEYGEKLHKYGVDYDVFASSYYPYWHGTLENLATQLNYITATYGKKTLVAETSYAYTTADTDFYPNTVQAGGGVVGYPISEQGQADFVRDVVDTAVNAMTDCIGVFYWEGTWISVGGESRDANEALWETYGSGWATSFAGSYDPEDAGKWYGGCAVDNQAFFDKTGKATEALKVFGMLKEGSTPDGKE
jgi:arabinogalactan endo-1,4-beta-galactosidase